MSRSRPVTMRLAVLPEGFLAQSRARFWHRPIEPPIAPSLTLIWRARLYRSPAAEAFLGHVLGRRVADRGPNA